MKLESVQILANPKQNDKETTTRMNDKNPKEIRKPLATIQMTSDVNVSYYRYSPVVKRYKFLWDLEALKYADHQVQQISFFNRTRKKWTMGKAGEHLHTTKPVEVPCRAIGWAIDFKGPLSLGNCMYTTRNPVWMDSKDYKRQLYSCDFGVNLISTWNIVSSYFA